MAIHEGNTATVYVNVVAVAKRAICYTVLNVVLHTNAPGNEAFRTGNKHIPLSYGSTLANSMFKNKVKQQRSLLLYTICAHHSSNLTRKGFLARHN